MYFFSNSLPVIGMHVAGIGHPLASDPPGHIILFSGQFDTVKGQETGHSFPSKPIGPISKNHYLTQINVIITLLGIRHFK